ncbi:YbdD/YjiX family protein [Microbacterium sufflavum]
MTDTVHRTDAATTPLRALWSALGRAGRGIRWYMTTLMGDTAYATYVAHHHRHHPDEEPLTERQFWRQRMDDQDRNPGARCC